MSEQVSPVPSGAGEVAAQTGGTATGQLRSNVLGLPHAVVISVAVMSPAASIFYNTNRSLWRGGSGSSSVAGANQNVPAIEPTL